MNEYRKGKKKDDVILNVNIHDKGTPFENRISTLVPICTVNYKALESAKKCLLLS